ncbi:MAG: 3-deoxy-manno-octulosonate cytidylyltransferase [Elusimicrobia bacterium]|nr:3-deoxy-manno-octulosonate cytidylyltransferase [Elusimicrobiota bacterium]
MKIVTVIPARYNSTRFHGKVLYPIDKKPMLQWVWERAVSIKGMDRVIIATEDIKVLDFAKSIAADALLTSPNCQSGSDRVWEVVKNIKCDIVVNLQSDEPFIEADVIKDAIELLIKRKDFDISTAVSKIDNNSDVMNSNCVKVVIGDDMNALYFSRLPVPYHHKLSEISKTYPYYKHCGFYVYRKEALGKYVSFKPSNIELLERLEQLRALENGLKIGVVMAERLGPAIDVLSDIKKAEKYIKTVSRIERSKIK